MKTARIAMAVMVAIGVMQAGALTITPDSFEILTGDKDENSQSVIDGILADFFLADCPECLVGEVYKQDVPEEGEDLPDDTGTYADSYVTEFFNDPDDPEDATITWEGPLSINSLCTYLLVKDGRQDPSCVPVRPRRGGLEWHRCVGIDRLLARGWIDIPCRHLRL